MGAQHIRLRATEVEVQGMHRISKGPETPIRFTFHRNTISRIDRSPGLISQVHKFDSSQNTDHVVIGLLLGLLLLLLSLLGLGSGTSSSSGSWGGSTTTTTRWDGSELLRSLGDELEVSKIS